MREKSDFSANQVGETENFKGGVLEVDFFLTYSITNFIRRRRNGYKSI